MSVELVPPSDDIGHGRTNERSMLLLDFWTRRRFVLAVVGGRREQVVSKIKPVSVDIHMCDGARISSLEGRWWKYKQTYSFL